jgi:hypothetical protein
MPAGASFTPPSSGGSGAGEVELLPAAGPIPAFSVVYVNSAGRLTKFDPANLTLAGKSVGLTLSSSSVIDDPVSVKFHGNVTFAGPTLIPFTSYYAGPNGSLMTTQPASDLLIFIGYSSDADSFIIDVHPPIER